MRKFLHIFLVLSLLISTAGYAVTKHFCGEVLSHTTVVEEPQSCCEEGDMSSDCCQNKADYIVVEDDFQQSHQEVNFTPALQATLLSFFKFLAYAPFSEEQSKKALLTLKYPPFTESSIHIRVQSFLL